MQILASLVTGLVVWIVVWALGAKADDAFLLALLILMGGVVARLTTPWIRTHILP